MNKRESNTQSESCADTDLIAAFLKGDKIAFDRLVLKYQKRIINLCYRLLGDYDEANDTAQETFVKVYRSLKNFRFQASFSTWIYRIAVNTCKNKLGSFNYRFHKKMVRLNGGHQSEGGAFAIQLNGGSTTPLNGLIKKEREATIQKAIDALSKHQKTVLILRDIEGHSYEEIARITGYTLGTVRSRLARAREELKKKLKGIYR
jgi:RNA polymerase sigma-70 factor (ECF subfamily)